MKHIKLLPLLSLLALTSCGGVSSNHTLKHRYEDVWWGIDIQKGVCDVDVDKDEKIDYKITLDQVELCLNSNYAKPYGGYSNVFYVYSHTELLVIYTY